MVLNLEDADLATEKARAKMGHAYPATTANQAAANEAESL
jgi:hypothetical protein